MDSKIIAAIIIAVGFVLGVYIYTQDNAFNRCVSYWAERESVSISEAKYNCVLDQKHFRD